MCFAPAGQVRVLVSSTVREAVSALDRGEVPNPRALVEIAEEGVRVGIRASREAGAPASPPPGTLKYTRGGEAGGGGL